MNILDYLMNTIDHSQPLSMIGNNTDGYFLNLPKRNFILHSNDLEIYLNRDLNLMKGVYKIILSKDSLVIIDKNQITYKYFSDYLTLKNLFNEIINKPQKNIQDIDYFIKKHIID